MRSTDGVSKKNNTHGVSESFNAKTEIDYHLEDLDRDGFTILKNIFSIEDCLKANEKIDQVYKKQVEEFGGEDKLIYINEQNIVRALFVYDDFFLKFIQNETILSILRKIFGKKYILNLQNSPINRPFDSHYGSTWHRDLSYQHFIPSRPIAINVLVCLDDFTKENGGTHILLGSHKHELFPSKNYCDKNDKQVIANVGDALVFDALLFHRAGKNNTDKVRRLLVHMFTLPFIKQQVNFPKMLNGKYFNDPELSYIIGYDSEIEDNVINWRKRRKRRYDKNS